MEYDHSRWIPYGIKVAWNDQNEWNPSQNIFHMEWMESTWNYMEFIWNPYGFHVEYGGRVKTSNIRLFKISSTTYSSSPSMSSGGGGGAARRPGIGSVGAGVSLTTLNTGWRRCRWEWGILLGFTGLDVGRAIPVIRWRQKYDCNILKIRILMT